MTKASGHAALIMAAGLWICAAGPSQAADGADNAATAVVKHGSYHAKKSAHAQLPASIANANARLNADTPASIDAKAMTERANSIVQAAADNTAAAQPAANSPVVASDQLNDVDRALAAPAAQPDTAAAAPVDAQQASPATPPAVIIAASGGNSTWNQTSLIGKIFIGFGALLTLASAARMFIA